MSTALEAWGSARGDGGSQEDDAPVNEDEMGTGTSASGEQDESFVPGKGGDFTTVAPQSKEIDARKKKGARVIYVAAGVCLLVLGGTAALTLMRAGAANVLPSQVAQAPQVSQVGQPAALAAPVGPQALGGEVQPPGADAIAPLGAAPAGGQPPQGSEQATGAPQSPAGPDFGVQSGNAPAPVQIQPPVQMQPPVLVGAAVPAVPSFDMAPAAKGPSPTAAKTDGAADLNQLRVELAAIRGQLEAKTKSVEELNSEVLLLKSQLANRPARTVVTHVTAKRPAKFESKPPVEKAWKAPAGVITETQAPVAAAAPAPSKSKVRSDFRIYASVDGRLWVLGGDGEPTQIGPRSPLPDGSRVTNIDVEKNIVYTTAGEIH